jgi:glutamate synthase (NADPH/NADH) small chain
MGKPTGFLEYSRETPERRPVAERIRDFFEIELPLPEERVRTQAARCMDCGVPFCHTGCPLENLIPDWNDAVWNGRFEEAARLLHSTNNFPEITGRICPAPCETSCVLAINQPAVTIKQMEKFIADRAWREGWVRPAPPDTRTGQRVAVVGSGPAGLAAAQQLNRAGHWVTVFEKADRIGGLLRYGIPDFKLEKHILDRRLAQMSAEGVVFRTNACVGGNVPIEDLRREFDAIVLAGGAEQPRDLDVPGRHLRGVHFAMDFLTQQNRRTAGDWIDPEQEILATGKHVVIIGGGDTGADCLGTCHRQQATSVHQLEIMPEPPPERSPETPWPLWPRQLRIESSHEEGGVRLWSVRTVELVGDHQGRVRGLRAVRVGPPPSLAPVPDSEFTLDADLVLLAMGFTGPVRHGLIEQLGLELDERGNVRTDGNYMTSVPGVFAAGDMRRGQSLVVWAIREGRMAARAVDRWLRSRC